MNKREITKFKLELVNADNSLKRELLLEEKISPLIDEIIEASDIERRKKQDNKCMNTYKKYVEGDSLISDDDCCPCASDFQNAIESKEQYTEIYNEMIEKLQPNEYEIEKKIKTPFDIYESMIKFRRDYPKGKNTAFIIMQFNDSGFHTSIVESIKQTLDKFGIIGLRADDKEYADDLFSNVKTYMYGCDFGIAIFERITENDFNPNVSLEVGYMLGLGKKVCLLKDNTLKGLQTDLAGKLYKPFSIQQITETINKELSKWIKDKFIE